MKIWDIVYPLGIYYVTVVIMMFAAQWIFGTDNAHYMLCQIVASAVTLPVMYYSFYRGDIALSGRKSFRQCWNRRMGISLLWISGITVLISIGLNNLISMSPLISLSEGYAAASADFYGSTLALELIGSAVLTPILEEMLYRGILYHRMREMMGIVPSVLLSSLIFGLIHFNLVQFVYAFLLGIVLALFVERTGHFYASAAAHMVANLLAVIRTETGFLAATVQGDIWSWTVSIVLFAAGILLLTVWERRNRKMEHAGETI